MRSERRYPERGSEHPRPEAVEYDKIREAQQDISANTCAPIYCNNKKPAAGLTAGFSGAPGAIRTRGLSLRSSKKAVPLKVPKVPRRLEITGFLSVVVTVITFPKTLQIPVGD